MTKIGLSQRCRFILHTFLFQTFPTEMENSIFLFFYVFCCCCLGTIPCSAQGLVLLAWRTTWDAEVQIQVDHIQDESLHRPHLFIFVPLLGIHEKKVCKKVFLRNPVETDLSLRRSQHLFFPWSQVGALGSFWG